MLALRQYDFVTGFETPTNPASEVVTSTKVQGGYNTPIEIDATGITPSNETMIEVIFTDTAAGEVDITTSPQIDAGTTVGQQLILWGTSNTDYILLENANGLSLNGQMALRAVECIGLMWNGNQWAEMFRRYNQ